MKYQKKGQRLPRGTKTVEFKVLLQPGPLFDAMLEARRESKYTWAHIALIALGLMFEVEEIGYRGPGKPVGLPEMKPKKREALEAKIGQGYMDNSDAEMKELMQKQFDTSVESLTKKLGKDIWGEEIK